ncbi:hypothetical protein DFJ73DRAFT_758764 [Zopfochytrium polystomum]|nr:hypothetical protein DFJ73DRAFT_758764 [Zopfochytrium polystomum]
MTKSNTKMAPPVELMAGVFVNLDLDTVPAFTRVCRICLVVSKDPYARAELLLREYGAPLALYRAFSHSRSALTGDTGRALLRMGAGLPRFLVQNVVQECAQEAVSSSSRESSQASGRRPLHPDTFAFFVQAGFEKYGNDMNYTGNDTSAFMKAMRNGAAGETEVRELITKFAWIPTRPEIVSEVCHHVSGLSMDLFDHLREQNGLTLSVDAVDGILRRVISGATLTHRILRPYLDRGLQLSSRTIKIGLRKCDAETLDVLRDVMGDSGWDDIVACAEDVLKETMEAEFTFSAGLARFLISGFDFGEEQVARALLMDSSWGTQPTWSESAQRGTRSLPVSPPSTPLEFISGAVHTFSLLHQAHQNGHPLRRTNSASPPLPPRDAAPIDSPPALPPREAPRPSTQRNAVPIPYLTYPLNLYLSRPPDAPLTRCYNQAYPAQAWRWILRNYGPQHRLTVACLTDAIKKLAYHGDSTCLFEFLPLETTESNANLVSNSKSCMLMWWHVPDIVAAARSCSASIGGDSMPAGHLRADKMKAVKDLIHLMSVQVETRAKDMQEERDHWIRVMTEETRECRALLGAAVLQTMSRHGSSGGSMRGRSKGDGWSGAILGSDELIVECMDVMERLTAMLEIRRIVKPKSALWSR